MDELPDGDYDCVVIDVEPIEENATRITFAITSGMYKGETMAIRATRIARDAIELLGLPASIEVRDGAPNVRW